MFGRKGISGDGRSNDFLAGQQVAVPVRTRAIIAPAADGDVAAPRIEQRTDAGNADRVPLGQVFGIVLIAVFGALIMEAAFSGTAIITPLNATYLYAMTGAGVVAGFLCWLYLLRSPRCHGFDNRRSAILCFFATPLFGAFAFNGFAWRLADVWQFGFSTAAFEQVRYPIKSVSHGRKGRRDVIEINPYGTGFSTDIPIPSSQYHAIWLDASGQCVTVFQRRSPSGAIEIRTDGDFTLAEPAPAAIAPCNGNEPGLIAPV